MDTSVTGSATYLCLCGDAARAIRASVLLLGPLLARGRSVVIPLPGGCEIGPRPLDLHFAALEAMGAKIVVRGGSIHATPPADGLVGEIVHFSKKSVGATENALLAAVLARGTTVLRGAAGEPEIAQLIECLRAMGANIATDTADGVIKIHGVSSLNGCRFAVMCDRIEAGTFMIAVAMAGGQVELIGASLLHLQAVVGALVEVGVTIAATDLGISVTRNLATPLRPTCCTAMPYPAFPSDLLAIFMSVLAVAAGESAISDRVFQSRTTLFVRQLARMGAEVCMNDSYQISITGSPIKLQGCLIDATDLRCAAALVVAALGAQGDSIVTGIEHLERGYERFAEKLIACGAVLRRIKV
jgi:UDP-N-acetylglucosamine 1-carboxyvinyltransferase